VRRLGEGKIIRGAFQRHDGWKRKGRILAGQQLPQMVFHDGEDGAVNRAGELKAMDLHCGNDECVRPFYSGMGLIERDFRTATLYVQNLHESVMAMRQDFPLV